MKTQITIAVPLRKKKPFAPFLDPVFQQIIIFTICYIVTLQHTSVLISSVSRSLPWIKHGSMKHSLLSPQLYSCHTPNIQVTLMLFLGIQLQSFSLPIGFLPWNLFHVIRSSQADEIVNSLWVRIIHITCFATFLGSNKTSADIGPTH